MSSGFSIFVCVNGCWVTVTNTWSLSKLCLSWETFHLFSNQLPSESLFIATSLSPEDNSAWVATFAKLYISLGTACLFLNGLSLG